MSGSVLAISRSPSSMNRSRSASGSPMIRASTRIGTSFATASTKSKQPSAGHRSSTCSVSSAMKCSYTAIARCEKVPDTILRSLVCSGGSVSMIVRRAAMSSSVGSSKETPRLEETAATSRLAATMSAYWCTDQKPDPSSGNHATGAWCRSRANSSYGTPRTHMSRSVRSTAPAIKDSLAPNELLRNGGPAYGAELSVHLFPDDGPLPAFDGVDRIVVLGAISSVNDPDPWISAELAWLRAAGQAGVPVLGICFGAQALCAAFGGRIEAMDHREFGWRLVESADPELV